MSLLFNETQQTPIVIAHRGASGYLPEHSLAAVAMAHAMDVDYIEQDVVLTSDGVPIVLHDVHIDTVTDVATVFPSRARSDGRYFAIDFTLDELKELKLCERIDFETGKAVYSRRFPVGKSSFRIPTLVEEIELIQGMNKSTGKSIGICVEIKSPAWHIEQGQHVSETTLSVLRSYGYCARADSAIIECFDATELRRIREQLDCRHCRRQMLSLDNPNCRIVRRLPTYGKMVRRCGFLVQRFDEITLSRHQLNHI